MTLVRYWATVNFPGGGTPSDYPVTVLHRGGNQPAILFADQAGTTPVDNPLNTDDFGMVSFWTAPGDYSITLAGDTFEVWVSDSHTEPVWPGIWIHTQTTPATVWTIEHHFGVQPQVEVLVGGQVVYATVAHPDDETTTISFGAATAGVAHLRR